MEKDRETLVPHPLAAAGVICVLAFAALVVFFAAPAAPTSPASHVRIRNDTKHAFYQVIVNGRHFGSIDAGKSSEYQELTQAFRYAKISLVTEKREIQLVPDDYVGETPLGRGRFTYALTLNEGDRPYQIVINVEQDSR